MRVSEVEIDAAGARLSGTVWSPDEAVAAPAVVLVGGSGPTDRTNAGYFDGLRDTLVAAGVVVLGYDKRGAGRSTGAWASATVDVLAADAVEAMRVLGAQPGVDRERVGLFGHSEGGWVALRSSTLQRCAFLIMNSAPAVPFVDAEVYALVRAGVGAAPARDLFEEWRSAVRRGADVREAARLLVGSADPQLRTVLDDAGFLLDPERWAQLSSWIDYTPDADLNSLSARTLAVYGAGDPLTPVEASITRLERRAPGVQVRLFAEADHRIQIDGQPAPGHLDAVAAWCAADQVDAT